MCLPTLRIGLLFKAKQLFSATRNSETLKFRYSSTCPILPSQLFSPSQHSISSILSIRWKLPANKKYAMWKRWIIPSSLIPLKSQLVPATRNTCRPTQALSVKVPSEERVNVGLLGVLGYFQFLYRITVWTANKITTEWHHSERYVVGYEWKFRSDFWYYHIIFRVFDKRIG